MQGDEVQKRVAEVAKAFYQRADELAVLACPRDHAPFVVGAADVRLSARRRCPQIACTLSSIDVYSAWMDRAYNDVHRSGSPANGRQDTPWGLQPAFLMSAASS